MILQKKQAFYLYRVLKGKILHKLSYFVYKNIIYNTYHNKQWKSSQQVLQALIEDELSSKKFPYSTSKLVQIKNETVRIFRLSFVGENGFELHIPKQSCKKIYAAVTEAGRKYKMKLAGYRALYSLSCEKGNNIDHIQ